MRKKSSGWQKSSLGEHQNWVTGHQSLWFLWHRRGARLRVSDRWGTWSLSWTLLWAGGLFPCQPDNGFCRARPASQFLWETQLARPLNQCGGHRLKAHGDSIIVSDAHLSGQHYPSFPFREHLHERNVIVWLCCLLTPQVGSPDTEVLTY